MANFTPTMNVKGLYTTKEPFNTVLLSGVLYEPIGIRSISDIVAGGVDPFETIYHPKGISREVYEKDLQDGVLIVSFQAGSGVPVYVPNSYITGQPDIGGVPYRTMMLAVQLAPVPDSLDLTLLQQRVADLVFDTLGVRGVVTPIVASPPSVLSQTEHDATEAARQHNIASQQTDLAKYLETKRLLDEARTQIQLRDDYITENITNGN